MSEAQWLRSLKTRLQARDSPPSQINGTSFYLDGDGLQLLHQENPFHLPPGPLATKLFQCYFQTVHVVFPLISPDIADQLQTYYSYMLKRQDVLFSQRWYATVNLILVIGAHFSRLSNAEWHTNPLDESVYISRACQLLGLSDTAAMLENPDLSLTQVGLTMSLP
jgi:hypothetical protein